MLTYLEVTLQTTLLLLVMEAPYILIKTQRTLQSCHRNSQWIVLYDMVDVFLLGILIIYWPLILLLSVGNHFSTITKPVTSIDISFWPYVDILLFFLRILDKLLLIYIWNFHALHHFLLIYICKLHWNLNTMFVCQVNSFWFTYVISMS